MKLKHLSRFIFVGLALIAVISLYGAWYAYIGKESADAVSLANQIQQKNQASVQNLLATDVLKQASADQGAVQGYFVPTSGVVPFLESLETTGKNLGSTVDVVSVSQASAKPHNVLNLSLHISGPFDSVMRTLGALEYGPYDIVMKSLTLDTAGAGAGQAPQWTAAATFLVGTTDATSTPVSSAPVRVSAVASTSPAAATSSATTTP